MKEIYTDVGKATTLPKRMLVWDDYDTQLKERIVLWINPDKADYTQCIAVSKYFEKQFIHGDKFCVETWSHYKELPQIEEMTLAQVCTELGRTIKIVK